MTDARRPEAQILRTRIRFALRRATGVVFDIDAMLRKPEFRERRIRLWREVGSDELSSLLDQLETEFQADGAEAGADAPMGAHKATSVLRTAARAPSGGRAALMPSRLPELGGRAAVR